MELLKIEEESPMHCRDLDCPCQVDYPRPGSQYIDQAKAAGLSVISLLRNPSRLIMIDDDSDSLNNEKLITAQSTQQDLGQGICIKDSYVTTSRRGHKHYYVVLEAVVDPIRASTTACYLGSDPFHEALACNEYIRGDEHPWVAGEKPEEIPGLLRFFWNNKLRQGHDYELFE